MNFNTSVDQPVSQELVINYLKSLVNRFFKILPIRENEEGSLQPYLKSLLNELIGCTNLITELGYNPMIMTLMSTLKFLIDNPDCSFKQLRRHVFDSISIINKIIAIYTEQTQENSK